MGIVKNVGKAVGETVKFFKDFRKEVSTNCREIPNELKKNLNDFKAGFVEGSKDPQETTDK